MHKRGLAPFSNCECGATKQTADHIVSQCTTHRTPWEIFDMMILDEETGCWLNSNTLSI